MLRDYFAVAYSLLFAVVMARVFVCCEMTRRKTAQRESDLDKARAEARRAGLIFRP